MEQSYHYPLINGYSVFQYEWYHLIAKGSPQSNEGYLFFIFVDHFDLVVPRETIHEGVH